MTVETLGRAFSLYRRTAASRSAVALVVANVIPLVGVLFFGWSLMTILVLYWVENGIVGFWNVPKIALARGSMLPTLPDLPADAAFAATGDSAAATELEERWRAAQAAQSALVQAQQAAQSAQAQAQSHAQAHPSPSVPVPTVQPALAPQPDRVVASRPTLRVTFADGRVLGPAATARLAALPSVGLSIFFLIHYGLFWLGHGLFVFLFLPNIAGSLGSVDVFGPSGGCLPGASFDPSLTGGFLPPGDALPPGFPGLESCSGGGLGEILWGSVAFGAVALFISHGASFLFNYLGSREYLTTSPARQMAAPYSRVVVLHLTIIFGGMVVAFLGSPIGALLVLVALKTAFDLGLHLREHGAPTGRLVPALQGVP